MRISVIIPALNEEEALPTTLAHAFDRDEGNYLREILVVDGGSTDRTMSVAADAGARLVRSAAGRARQMNAGAKAAGGDILFFLHADTVVPPGYTDSIMEAITQKADVGSFRLSFGHPSALLRFYGWCTRFDWGFLRYGDQGLFLKKETFEALGGFSEELRVLEDNEVVGRIKGRGLRFAVLKKAVTTSPRRYLEHGTLRLQLVFTAIYLLWKCGADQDQLLRLYRRMIRTRIPR